MNNLDILFKVIDAKFDIELDIVMNKIVKMLDKHCVYDYMHHKTLSDLKSRLLLKINHQEELDSLLAMKAIDKLECDWYIDENLKSSDINYVNIFKELNHIVKLKNRFGFEYFKQDEYEHHNMYLNYHLQDAFNKDQQLKLYHDEYVELMKNSFDVNIVFDLFDYNKSKIYTDMYNRLNNETFEQIYDSIPKRLINFDEIDFMKKIELFNKLHID